MLSKEELEERLEKVAQYCTELGKINRILDLENKIAVAHLVKLQKGGYNIELENKSLVQPRKKTEVRKKFKL